MNNLSHHTCIYCKETKYNNSFNSEHVFNKAFGLYSTQTLTLVKIVCKDCNDYFGKTIDKVLARDIIEGHARFLFGIKSISEFKREHFKNSTRIIVNSFLRGLEVEIIPDNNNFYIYPYRKDIGIRRADNTYDFFSLEEISNEFVCEKTYPLHQDRIIILPATNFTKIKQTLYNKWRINNYKIFDCSNIEFNTLANCLVTLDHKRAIAKIAFNYLAYLNKNNVECLLHSAFDPIRNFIRNGEENINYIEVNNRTLIQGNLHYITIEMNENRAIIANVSLFTYYNYRITLTPNLPFLAIKLNAGSVFDNNERKILPFIRSSLIMPQYRIFTARRLPLISNLKEFIEI